MLHPGYSLCLLPYQQCVDLSGSLGLDEKFPHCPMLILRKRTPQQVQISRTTKNDNIAETYETTKDIATHVRYRFRPRCFQICFPTNIALELRNFIRLYSAQCVLGILRKKFEFDSWFKFTIDLLMGNGSLVRTGKRIMQNDHFW